MRSGGPMDENSADTILQIWNGRNPPRADVHSESNEGPLWGRLSGRGREAERLLSVPEAVHGYR